MTLRSFQDRRDFDDVARGKVADLVPEVITADDGHVVWDVHGYDFPTSECPPTANPSLWRQARSEHEVGREGSAGSVTRR